ncbi:trypsin protease GIP-like protein, partial [Leptotrombidium deliense]
MKVVNVPLMSLQQCRNYFNVDDGQICAGGINGHNSCRGDSGGPLVWANNGWYTLIGLSSYGPALCASDGKPNVFTRVAFYSQWIRNIAGSMQNPEG